MKNTTAAICFLAIASLALCQNPLDNISAELIVQTSQALLDEAAQLITSVVVNGVERVTLPDLSIDQINLTDSKVKLLEKIHVQLATLPQKEGVELSLTAGRAELISSYSLDVGLLTSDGTVRMLVTGFRLNLLLNSNMTLAACEASLQEVRVMFKNRGWSGALLNSARFTLASFFKSNSKSLLCPAIQQFIDDFYNAPWLVNPKRMFEIFCPDLNNTLSEDDRQRSPFGMAVALLKQPIRFDQLHIAWPLQVLITYNGKAGPSEPTIVNAKATGRMLTLYLNEAVVNAFFHHVHSEEMASMELLLDSKLLPKRLRLAFAMLCWSCEMNLFFGLASEPRFLVTSENAIVELQTSLVILVNTWIKRFTLLSAKSSLHIVMKISQDNTGRPQLELNLLAVNIKIERMKFKKVLGNAVEEFAESLIKKKVWPKLVDKCNKVVSSVKLNMNHMCGVNFTNILFANTDGAIVISTDVTVDKDGTLDKIHELMKILTDKI